MRADGSDVDQLTDGQQDSQPAWSPDGERIAFTANGRLKGEPSAAQGRMYAINADGRGQVNLTDGPGRRRAEQQPGLLTGRAEDRVPGPQPGRGNGERVAHGRQR